MDFDVHIKTSFTSKWFVAEGTVVRFFPSMPTNMSLEIMLPLRLILAVGALQHGFLANIVDCFHGYAMFIRTINSLYVPRFIIIYQMLQVLV